MRSMKAMLSTTILLAALALPALVHAQAKVPVTAADHLALAKSYQEKAATYRKEVAEHKAMAEAYKKTRAMPVTKGGVKDPYLAKMEKHCEALQKDAEKLAADAEKAADYHSQRAKEMQGK